MYIPLSIPNFMGNEKKYVNEALEQGWVSTGGAFIKELEQRMGTFLCTHNVAACQSGTAALHLCLIEAKIGPGDVVIVPTLTFIAAVNPVAYQGAMPIFIDCDDSLCIDPQKIEIFCSEECEWDGEKLKYEGNTVKAIMVVHVFGNMADMEKINAIAKRFNLIVIEDATEALGSKYEVGEYKGKYAGTIGDFGAFSFNGNKIITTGGGGAVTAKSNSTVDHIRFLSTQAKTDSHYYTHNEIGYNYRMTNVQAALGVAQFEELPEFIQRKQENYNLYQKEFEGFELAKLLAFRKGTASNKWFYSLFINRNKVKCSLHQIIERLEVKNIQTRPIWGLIHEQVPYRESLAYRIEKATFYADCVLNIPCSTQITFEEIQYVSHQIKQILEDCNEK